MFCTKCGKDNDDNARFCQMCGSPLKIQTPKPTVQKTLDLLGWYEKAEFLLLSCFRKLLNIFSGKAFPENIEYARFGKRFFATIIDWIFVGIIVGILLIPIDIVLVKAKVDFSTIRIIGYILAIIFYLSYYIESESSADQATLGKKMEGIIVTDLNGNRISEKRATIRFFAKIISFLPFCLGFIIAVFTPKKQALHDYIAGTLVVVEKRDTRDVREWFVCFFLFIFIITASWFFWIQMKPFIKHPVAQQTQTAGTTVIQANQSSDTSQISDLPQRSESQMSPVPESTETMPQSEPLPVTKETEIYKPESDVITEKVAKDPKLVQVASEQAKKGEELFYQKRLNEITDWSISEQKKAEADLSAKKIVYTEFEKKIKNILGEKSIKENAAKLEADEFFNKECERLYNEMYSRKTALEEKSSIPK